MIALVKEVSEIDYDRSFYTVGQRISIRDLFEQLHRDGLIPCTSIEIASWQSKQPTSKRKPKVPQIFISFSNCFHPFGAVSLTDTTEVSLTHHFLTSPPTQSTVHDILISAELEVGTIIACHRPKRK